MIKTSKRVPRRMWTSEASTFLKRKYNRIERRTAHVQVRAIFAGDDAMFDRVHPRALRGAIGWDLY